MAPRQMIEEINQKIEMGHALVPWWKKRWVKLLLIWVIWTFIGIIFTLQSYFMSYRSERPIPFVDALYLQMTWSYLWALATPLVLWLTHKITIDRHNWVRGA